MDSLLLDPDFMNKIYKFNPELLSIFSMNPNIEMGQTHDSENDPSSYGGGSCVKSCSSEEAPDFPDACLKFISDILIEEGLDESPPTSVEDFTALEETEKSLYDALGLGDSYSSSASQSIGHAQPSEPSFNDSGTAQVKSIKSSRRKKSRQRDDHHEGRKSRKVQASFHDDYYEMEQYDDVVLLCSNKQEGGSNTQKSSRLPQGRRANKDSSSSGDEVDLMTLLNQCAQAVSSFDLRGANELLRQTRQHASPYGDSIQRLAHHVANALEARIAGTGSTVSTNLIDAKFSASDFLKAYRLYVSAIPFKRMSFFLGNSSIAKLVEKATKIHIIDFGVFLGLQWPCLLRHLSERPNGPPSVRITGIDYPQQGFRPAQRVEATGRRLSGYCERFGIPFSYQGIAQKWETIQPEDLKMEKDEVVIVNCMFRSGTLLDETVEANSPRDAFLALVRKLNPSLFIHGVVNGTFNAPFFMTRFREALYHYSSVFDVFDETIPRGAHERFLIESEIYGKELFNVVACEGAERVQRPDTYKQWLVRTTRAGFRQVPLDQELLEKTKSMVKGNYHKDFMVDTDRHWMLQGWKGRTFCALSFWQPA